MLGTFLAGAFASADLLSVQKHLYQEFLAVIRPFLLQHTVLEKLSLLPLYQFLELRLIIVVPCQILQLRQDQAVNDPLASAKPLSK